MGALDASHLPRARRLGKRVARRHRGVFRVRQGLRDAGRHRAVGRYGDRAHAPPGAEPRQSGPAARRSATGTAWGVVQPQPVSAMRSRSGLGHVGASRHRGGAPPACALEASTCRGQSSTLGVPHRRTALDSRLLSSTAVRWSARVPSGVVHLAARCADDRRGSRTRECRCRGRRDSRARPGQERWADIQDRHRCSRPKGPGSRGGPTHTQAVYFSDSAPLALMCICRPTEIGC